jgi:arginyl-tRNA synthetase
MTTQTIPSLKALIGGWGVQIPIPSFLAAGVLVRPLDIGRSYLADIISNIVKCDAVKAFNLIYWPNNVDNGDLVVILPKLSHGANTNVLAQSLIQQVLFRSLRKSLYYFRESTNLTPNISSNVPCSVFLL